MKLFRFHRTFTVLHALLKNQKEKAEYMLMNQFHFIFHWLLVTVLIHECPQEAFFFLLQIAQGFIKSIISERLATMLQFKRLLL